MLANFNRDFTIQNHIASRFHCKTIVLKKVSNKKLYNIKSTKSIFLHPVYIYMIYVQDLYEDYCMSMTSTGITDCHNI